jgi:hypothetical protein
MADTRLYSTGKRKTAVARVWISPGSGKITVNKRPADEYFVRETSRMVMRQSLELIEVRRIKCLCRLHQLSETKLTEVPHQTIGDTGRNATKERLAALGGTVTKSAATGGLTD